MINTKRLLLAYVVALVVALVYNYLVFGMLLGSVHDANRAFLRSDYPTLRIILTSALNVALITVFYALFARAGAARFSTGLVFGILLGLIAGWVPQVYAQLTLANYPFYMAWAPANFVGYFLLGVVLGCVYRE